MLKQKKKKSNLEKRNYKKEYWKNPEYYRTKARRHYSKHRKEILEKNKTEEVRAKRRKYGRKYHQTHREKDNKKWMKYYYRNQEYHKKRREKWFRKKLKENPRYLKESYNRNKEKRRKESIDYYWRIKLEVFEHYKVDGKVKCNCIGCDVDNIIFLTIDHVNRYKDKIEREKNLRGVALYNHIKRQEFPKRYQILCWNCNVTRGKIGFCHDNKNYNKLKMVRNQVEFLKMRPKNDVKNTWNKSEN